MQSDRRSFLSLAGLASLGVLGLGHAARAQGAEGTCVDLASLPLMQKNRRRSLGYVDPAPDPKKRCGGCAFFTATQGSCGTCQMLSGGAVSAAAVCNSFAPKPA